MSTWFRPCRVLSKAEGRRFDGLRGWVSMTGISGIAVATPAAKFYYILHFGFVQLTPIRPFLPQCTCHAQIPAANYTILFSTIHFLNPTVNSFQFLFLFLLVPLRLEYRSYCGGTQLRLAFCQNRDFTLFLHLVFDPLFKNYLGTEGWF